MAMGLRSAALRAAKEFRYDLACLNERGIAAIADSIDEFSFIANFERKSNLKIPFSQKEY